MARSPAPTGEGSGFVDVAWPRAEGVQARPRPGPDLNRVTTLGARALGLERARSSRRSPQVLRYLRRRGRHAGS